MLTSIGLIEGPRKVVLNSVRGHEAIEVVLSLLCLMMCGKIGSDEQI
jgi:hypothetical protein